MTRLDDLIDCDTTNAALSREALQSIERRALEAIESCATAMKVTRDAFSEAADYDSHHKSVEVWAKRHGLRGNEALRLLRDATPIGSVSSGDDTVKAQQELHVTVAILARMHLALRLERDFLFGITDLLRLRIASALGCLRLQAETAAQMRLLVENPEMAEEWFATADVDEAQSFYRKRHRAIVEVTKRFDLRRDCVRAAAVALHSRAGGTAAGILLGAKEGKPRGELRLVYQEVGDARLLFFWFGVYMALHRKVLLRTTDLFPEVSPEIMKHEEVIKFLEAERAVWRKAKEAHRRLKADGIERVLSGT